MARIPSADGLGQVVAQPSWPDRRQGDAVAQATRGLANTIGSIAADAQQTIRAEDERVRQEQIRLQRTADHANATKLVNDGRDSARAARDEFVEGITSGTIPKNEAAERWQQRLTDIRQTSLEGVPSEFVTGANADFDSLGAGFSRDITKAVNERNRSEVRDGLNSAFESAQRLYMKDPAGARAMVDGAIQQFGPASGLSVEDLGKSRQSWEEKASFAKTSGAIVDARRDNKALAKVETELSANETMDPQRKVQLMGQIEGFKVANIQRAEAEAARARSAQDAALRKAESAFNAASSLVLGGKTLSPEYVTQLSNATAGTPYAAALPDLLKQAPERSAFGMQPVGVMDATINQIRADLNVKGTDPRTEKRVNEMEAIRDGKRKALAEDPLIGAQEYGGPPIPQIDTRSVAGLVGTLAGRQEAVTFASGQLGGQAVSPLTKQETEAVGQLINALPVEQRSSAIAQIAQVIGPQQSAALGRQMAPKDDAVGLAFGLAGDRTTNGRYTSELVLRGAQAIKDKAVKKDGAAITGTRAIMAAEIGDAYVDQGVRDAMISAAVYAEYGLQSEGSGDPRRAVRLVTGGLTTQAGKKIPLPRGMEASEFSKRLTTLTPDNLRTALPEGKVYVSGTAMEPADFLKQVPNASLISAGQGRYAVQTGAGIATNAAGLPVILEVK